jgi:salicylate hydroxylase
MQRFGAPYMMAHRPDLHQLLIGLVPSAAVHLDMPCISCANSDRGATAKFANGQEIEADVIVGADGIHSAIRQLLFGESPARFTNQICWRAMVPIEYAPTTMSDGSDQLAMSSAIPSAAANT